MFTYGVFFKEFQAEFGWSRAAISGASSLAFLTMGLVGVIAGKMNKNIAIELGTGEQNVKVHRRRVMRKMGVKSLADLVRTAERLGIEPAR